MIKITKIISCYMLFIKIGQELWRDFVKHYVLMKMNFQKCIYNHLYFNNSNSINGLFSEELTEMIVKRLPWLKILT